MAKDWFCTEGCTAAADCKRRSEFDGACVYEYDAKQYEPQFRWKGDGDPPRRWWASGTLVYRTFADSCD